jgi:hypothetical protein
VLARFHAEADDGFLAEPLGGGVFGTEMGKHARSAVGMQALRLAK